MVAGGVWTCDLQAAPMSDYSAFVGASAPLTLGDIVARTAAAPESYYLPEEALFQWHYLKGGKSVERVTARGFAYTYSEGPVTFPDDLAKPSRTVITGEGGSSASRFKHVIATTDGRLRRLTPDELEELNGFPRGFTALDKISDVKRAFFYGICPGSRHRCGDWARAGGSRRHPERVPLNRHAANICDCGAIHPARLAHFAEAQQKTCFTGSSSEPAVMDNIIYAKD